MAHLFSLDIRLIPSR